MRKETILTNAPIGQWVSKTNLMSDYIGDLDNYEFIKEFKPYVMIERWDSDFDPPYFKGFHFRSD